MMLAPSRTQSQRSGFALEQIICAQVKEQPYIYPNENNCSPTFQKKSGQLSNLIVFIGLQ